MLLTYWVRVQLKLHYFTQDLLPRHTYHGPMQTNKTKKSIVSSVCYFEIPKWPYCASLCHSESAKASQILLLEKRTAILSLTVKGILSILDPGLQVFFSSAED